MKKVQHQQMPHEKVATERQREKKSPEKNAA